MPSPALATGINGFVGAHLAAHLLERGDELHGLSRTGEPPRHPLVPPERVAARALDLALFDLRPEPDSSSAPAPLPAADPLVALLGEIRPRAIYHLAALANPREALRDPRRAWAVNWGGAFRLLEAARLRLEADPAAPRPRIVLVSTGMAYGRPATESIDESHPWRPDSPYGASKAAADLLGVQYALGRGLDVVIARPFNHVGPGQSADYFLPALAGQVAEVEAGRRAEVELGNLDVERDFTDARDVVRAYRLLAEADPARAPAGEVYNVGTGVPVPLGEIVERFRALANVPFRVTIDPARVRPGEPRRIVVNADKLRDATGWAPRIPIDRTLRDILDDARARVAAASASAPVP